MLSIKKSSKVNGSNDSKIKDVLYDTVFLNLRHSHIKVLVRDYELRFVDN